MPSNDSFLSTRFLSENRESFSGRGKMEKSLQKIEEKVAGIVKWFNEKKGYGFVQKEGEDKDIFVHFSEISGDNKILKEGDKITFSLYENDRGLIAKKVSMTSKKFQFTSAEDLPPLIKEAIVKSFSRQGEDLSDYLLAEENFYVLASLERIAKALENYEEQQAIDDIGEIAANLIEKFMKDHGAMLINSTSTSILEKS